MLLILRNCYNYQFPWNLFAWVEKVLRHCRIRMNFVTHNYFLSRPVSVFSVCHVQFYSMRKVLPQKWVCWSMWNIDHLLEWNSQSRNWCHSWTPMRSMTNIRCGIYSHRSHRRGTVMESNWLKRKNKDRMKDTMGQNVRERKQTKKKNWLNTSTWKESNTLSQTLRGSLWCRIWVCYSTLYRKGWSHGHCGNQVTWHGMPLFAEQIGLVVRQAGFEDHSSWPWPD